MRAGKLDRRIRILFRVATQAANGETVTTWPVSGAKDTWAMIGQPYAREIIKNNVTISVTAFEVRIRWRPGVTAECKIEYDGRTLQVAQVLGENTRREEIQMVAHEELPAGVG